MQKDKKEEVLHAGKDYFLPAMFPIRKHRHR